MHNKYKKLKDTINAYVCLCKCAHTCVRVQAPIKHFFFLSL